MSGDPKEEAQQDSPRGDQGLRGAQTSVREEFHGLAAARGEEFALAVRFVDEQVSEQEYRKFEHEIDRTEFDNQC